MSSLVRAERIVRTWVEKGDSEQDAFSKFICYWVAFNCWLYTQTNETGDKKALDILFENSHLYSQFRKIATQRMPLLEGLQAVCPIKNNRIASREKSLHNIESFPEIVDVLYEVRCNLFHGSKSDADERDIEVLNASTPVLELIVKNICLPPK